MPPHPTRPTHPTAESRPAARATSAVAPAAGGAVVHPLAAGRYRERLKALRVRAPDALRVRIRRELRAAREAVAR